MHHQTFREERDCQAVLAMKKCKERLPSPIAGKVFWGFGEVRRQAVVGAEGG
jgi:hypothetical protein